MTQGLVAVMEGGEVLYKCVAGCNGYNGPELANHLKGYTVTDPTEAFRIARQVEFGCPDCLVIVHNGGKDILSHNVQDVGPLYASTFHNPWFNPRWEQGTAAYTEIVELGPAPLVYFDESTEVTPEVWQALCERAKP